MRMYKYTKDAPEYNCVSPVYLYGRESPDNIQHEDPDHPLSFAHPHTRDEDERELRSCLPRVLAVLSTLKTREKPAQATRGGGERSSTPLNGPAFRASHACPFADAPENKQAEFYGDFNKFSDGTTHSMRVIVTDIQRLLAQPKTFIIGFFSKLGNPTDGVIKKVWDLDDRLVTALTGFSCILGYVTCRKANGDYYNYVFLEDDAAVQKWRCFAQHGSAVTISPLYYDWVRINHAVLPCSLNSIMDIPGGEKKLEIIRTKYFKYRDAKCVWRGIRKYKNDEVFHSLAEHQPISPFVFASFGSEREYDVHKRTVEYLERVTGLPMKIIDIADMEPRDGADEGPSEFSHIQKYNIDFAFTSRDTYTSSFPNLNALASPVYSSKHEDAYDDNIVDDAARAHYNANVGEVVVASVWVPMPVQKMVRNALANMHKHKQEILDESSFERYAPASMGFVHA